MWCRGILACPLHVFCNTLLWTVHFGAACACVQTLILSLSSHHLVDPGDGAVGCCRDLAVNCVLLSTRNLPVSTA